MPPATAGDDSPIRLSAVLYFHFGAPEARSSATRSPSPPPTYTTPSAIAADDSMVSPASYDHSSLSVAGGALAERPVCWKLPRKLRHSVAGDIDPAAGCCAASAGATRSHSAVRASRGVISPQAQ